MKKYFVIIVIQLVFIRFIVNAKTKRTGLYQNGPFLLVTQYPIISDSSAFIKRLKINCHITPDVEYGHSIERITAFQKLKIYGSAREVYLLEYSWQKGSNVTFPWRYQLIFDQSGRLILSLSAIRFQLLSVFPKSDPFLLVLNSTYRGNGNHKLYRFKNGKMVNVLNYPRSFCVETYDADADETINIPNELKLNVTDVNNDGYNDLKFSGILALTMGISSDGTWYDSEIINNKLVEYSILNPYKKIPINVVFFYDSKTGLFSPTCCYQRYCVDSLYKLVYNEKAKKR